MHERNKTGHDFLLINICDDNNCLKGQLLNIDFLLQTLFSNENILFIGNIRRVMDCIKDLYCIRKNLITAQDPKQRSSSVNGHHTNTH